MTWKKTVKSKNFRVNTFKNWRTFKYTADYKHKNFTKNYTNQENLEEGSVGWVMCMGEKYTIPNEEQLLKGLREQFGIKYESIPVSPEYEDFSYFEKSNGWRYNPKRDTEDHYLGIVVPIGSLKEHKNGGEIRCDHLRFHLGFMKIFLKNFKYVYTLIINQQNADKPFNKAAILNIAVRNLPPEVDYIIFHDSDFVPASNKNSYHYHPKPIGRCPEKIVKGKLRGTYDNYGGAILQVPRNIWMEMGGASNGYWGPTCQDDDIGKRISQRNVMYGGKEEKIVKVKKGDGLLYHMDHPRKNAQDLRNRNFVHIRNFYIERSLYDNIYRYDKNKTDSISYTVLEREKYDFGEQLHVQLDFTEEESRKYECAKNVLKNSKMKCHLIEEKVGNY